MVTYLWEGGWEDVDTRPRNFLSIPWIFSYPAISYLKYASGVNMEILSTNKIFLIPKYVNRPGNMIFLHFCCFVANQPTSPSVLKHN